MAAIFNSLMIDTLGYKKYIAQGGDFGGTICTWLAYDFPKNLLPKEVILVEQYVHGWRMIFQIR